MSRPGTSVSLFRYRYPNRFSVIILVSKKFYYHPYDVKLLNIFKPDLYTYIQYNDVEFETLRADDRYKLNYTTNYWQIGLLIMVTSYKIRITIANTTFNIDIRGPRAVVVSQIGNIKIESQVISDWAHSLSLVGVNEFWPKLKELYELII